jgi:hypothetical protein
MNHGGVTPAVSVDCSLGFVRSATRNFQNQILDANRIASLSDQTCRRFEAPHLFLLRSMIQNEHCDASLRERGCRRSTNDRCIMLGKISALERMEQLLEQGDGYTWIAKD